LGFLKHARSCLGRVDGKACPICRRIDRQLSDGSRYAVEDRQERENLLRHALQQTEKLSLSLHAALERSPVQTATRKTSLQLTEWLAKILLLLDEPITGGTRRQVSGKRPERMRVVLTA